MFPQLPRPLYETDPFAVLLLDHLALVGVSGAVSIVVGVVLAVAVTRARAARSSAASSRRSPPWDRRFRPSPFSPSPYRRWGSGRPPAIVALTLYGLLPIVENTVAGLVQIAPAIKEAALGAGMTAWQTLWRVELPLAAPVILAGARTSVTINVGTAALASTVGAKSLGLPIIVGLNASNTAYVLQGALLTGALALSLDQLFELALWRVEIWRRDSAR